MNELKKRIVSSVLQHFKTLQPLLLINNDIIQNLHDFVLKSELYRFLGEKFLSVRVKAAKKNALFLTSLTLNEVQAELLYLANTYSNQVMRLTTIANMTEREVCLDVVKKSLTQFFDDRTRVLDTRIQNDEDRLQRRMDALARLLTLPNKESVCTAVTSYDGVLWVAMNRDNKNSFDSVLDSLYKRIVFIRNAINSYHKIDYKELLEELVPQLVRQGIRPGEISVTKEIVEKDLAKLINSNHPEIQLFTTTEQPVFQDLPVIFIFPAVANIETSPCLGIQTVRYSLGNKDSEFYALELANTDSIRLKDLHAEQLLIHLFMFKELLASDKPLRLGISKLCCRTCHDYLSTVPPRENLIFRGIHNGVYEGTVNLATGERAPAETEEVECNQRLTHSIPSPKMSPLKILPTFFKHDVIARRHLNFSENMSENKLIPPTTNRTVLNNANSSDHTEESRQIYKQ